MSSEDPIKACYSPIQKGGRLNLPTDSMLKLFDSCVEPSLLYGYENVDILEKVHRSYYFFVNVCLECPNTHIICRYMENWEDIHCQKKLENGSLLDDDIKK